MIDLIISCFLAGAAYFGYKSGFFVELIGTIGFLFALVAAAMLLDLSLSILKPFLGSGIWVPIVVFILLFFVGVYILRLLALQLALVLKQTTLGTLDSLGGMVLNMLKVAFGLSVFFWVLHWLEIRLPEDWLTQSKTYPAIMAIAPKFLGLSSKALPFLLTLFESLRNHR